MNDEPDSLLEDESDVSEVWSEVDRSISDGTYTDDLLTFAFHSGTTPPPDLALRLQGYLQTRTEEGAKHDRKRATRQCKRDAARDVELAMRMGGKYREAMDEAIEKYGFEERTIQTLRAKLYPKRKP